MKVADAVWLATALLHQEHPQQIDFSVQEIVERAMETDVVGCYRPGLQVHASKHCVAGKSANPGRYRMLVETERGRRRLFRRGDPYDPSREGGKVKPAKDELPSQHHHVLDWYDNVYCRELVQGRPPLKETAMLVKDLITKILHMPNAQLHQVQEYVNNLEKQR